VPAALDEPDIRRAIHRRRLGVGNVPAYRIGSMIKNNLLCWKCGTALADLPLPLSRMAECPKCQAYQHICLMCLSFNRNAPKQCREQDAEEVKEKERPNFCDYFRPNPAAFNKGDAKSQSAKSTLDSLFGGAAESENNPDVARSKLDDLFGKK
jgi:hypothetical protein